MSATAPTSGAHQRERPIRIGEVVRRLREEFPDISISKIRFLEDEGLLSPQRTRGGYRLFSEHDLERLVTILRLQRDEFLPLRVIRDELAAPGAAERKRRRPAALGERVALDRPRTSSASAPAIAARVRKGARGVRSARPDRLRSARSATPRATSTSRSSARS